MVSSPRSGGPAERTIPHDHSTEIRRDTADLRAAADDIAADARDCAALWRDWLARAREIRTDGAVNDIAERYRNSARLDRRAAARDRQRAARDRDRARADRAESLAQRRMWRIDATTGALRREAGEVELQRLVMSSAAHGTGMVVVFVDVDGLKRINDSHGHAAGDDVLRSVAHALRGYAGESAVVVRHGGDEFVVGAEGVSAAEMRTVMDRVATHLRTWCETTVTTGVAEWRCGETLSALIERADAELYRVRDSLHSTAN